MSEKHQVSQTARKKNAQSQANGQSAPRRTVASSSRASAQEDIAAPPYTNAEKEYLKATSHRNEYHFLRNHNLRIHSETDRKEGRRMLRELDDSEINHDDVDDDDDDDGDSFLADIESDPSSHVADHHFSDAQLTWIKQHYRHSGNFLINYGLKPWDDEDCREGRQMLREMMQE